MMIRQLALATILLFPAAATAAQPSTAQQFAAVLQNPGHRQMVLATAEQSPAWTHIACPAASFAPAPEIGVYAPMLFDHSGEPISGEWREGLIANGCGAAITLNVLTRITAPATLATGFLLPGDTIADPILQNAAQAAALKATGGLPAGCRDAYIADTEFTAYDNRNAKQTGSWKEIWTLDLCGPPKQVSMHFLINSGSVTIDAEPWRP